jgi:hypothetical protein
MPFLADRQWSMVPIPEREPRGSAGLRANGAACAAEATGQEDSARGLGWASDFAARG